MGGILYARATDLPGKERIEKMSDSDPNPHREEHDPDPPPRARPREHVRQMQTHLREMEEYLRRMGERLRHLDEQLSLSWRRKTKARYRGDGDGPQEGSPGG